MLLPCAIPRENLAPLSNSEQISHRIICLQKLWVQVFFFFRFTFFYKVSYLLHRVSKQYFLSHKSVGYFFLPKAGNEKKRLMLVLRGCSQWRRKWWLGKVSAFAWLSVSYREQACSYFQVCW